MAYIQCNLLSGTTSNWYGMVWYECKMHKDERERGYLSEKIISEEVSLGTIIGTTESSPRTVFQITESRRLSIVVRGVEQACAHQRSVVVAVVSLAFTVNSHSCLW
eukprot:scaffold5158_cov153-Amphora_coffeaeformis.AAC.4